MQPILIAVGEAHAKWQTLFEKLDNKRQMYGSQSTMYTCV